MNTDRLSHSLAYFAGRAAATGGQVTVNDLLGLANQCLACVDDSLGAAPPAIQIAAHAFSQAEQLLTQAMEQWQQLNGRLTLAQLVAAAELVRQVRWPELPPLELVSEPETP